VQAEGYICLPLAPPSVKDIKFISARVELVSGQRCAGYFGQKPLFVAFIQLLRLEHYKHFVQRVLIRKRHLVSVLLNDGRSGIRADIELGVSRSYCVAIASRA
jgi:hypothetical protein